MKRLLSAAILIAASTHGVYAESVCTKTQSCRTAVTAEVQRQNTAAASGPRWTLSRSGCQTASREQEANTKHCRAYDAQPGGKTHEQCAKCFRQAVFDTARWEQCAAMGWAPPVAPAQYQSIAELGKSLLASK